MPIVKFNGKRYKFPDGVSDDQIHDSLMGDVANKELGVAQSDALPALPKPQVDMKKATMIPGEGIVRGLAAGNAEAAADVDRLAANAAHVVGKVLPRKDNIGTRAETALRNREKSLRQNAQEVADDYDIGTTGQVAKMAGRLPIDVGKYAIAQRLGGKFIKNPIAADAIAQGAVDAATVADEGAGKAIAAGAKGATAGAILGKTAGASLPKRIAAGAAAMGGTELAEEAITDPDSVDLKKVGTQAAVGALLHGVAGGKAHAEEPKSATEIPPPPEPKPDWIPRDRNLKGKMLPAPEADTRFYAGEDGSVKDSSRPEPVFDAEPTTKRPPWERPAKQIEAPVEDAEWEPIGDTALPPPKPGIPDSRQIAATSPEPPAQRMPPSVKPIAVDPEGNARPADQPPPVPGKPFRPEQPAPQPLLEAPPSFYGDAQGNVIPGPEAPVGPQPREQRPLPRQAEQPLPPPPPPMEEAPTPQGPPSPPVQEPPAPQQAPPAPVQAPIQQAPPMPPGVPQQGKAPIAPPLGLKRPEPPAPPVVNKATGSAYDKAKAQFEGQLWGNQRQGKGPMPIEKVQQLAAELNGGKPPEIRQEGNYFVGPTGTKHANPDVALRSFVGQNVEQVMANRGFQMAAPKAEAATAARPEVEVHDEHIDYILKHNPDLARTLKQEYGAKDLASARQMMREDFSPEELRAEYQKAQQTVLKSKRASQGGFVAVGNPIEAAKNLREKLRHYGETINDTMADRMGPAKRLFKDIGINEKNPYLGFRLFAGVAGKIENLQHDFYHTVVKPFDDSGMLDKAIAYANLQRFNELRARGIDGEGIPPQDVIDRGLAGMATELGPQKMQQIDGMLGKYREFHSKLMDYAKDSGLISDETLAKIKQDNQMYVPMLKELGDVTEAGNALRNGKTFDVSNQHVVRRILGKKGNLIDPFESTLKIMNKLVDEGERNKAARSVADLAHDPNYAGTITEVRSYTQNGKTIHTQVPHDFGTFKVMIEGKPREFAAPHALVEMMKSQDTVALGETTKLLRMTTAPLKAGATAWNTAFVAWNFLRDQVSAKMNSEYGYRVLQDGLPAVWHAVNYNVMGNRSELVERFLQSGAGGATRFDMYGHTANESLAKLRFWNGTKGKLLNAASPKTWAESLELATRLGVYSRAEGKGATSSQAAFDARNATVDFAKSGRVGRVVNLAVPFFNARLQGNLNNLKSLGEMIHEPKKYANRWATMAAGATVASYLYHNNAYTFGHVWDKLSDRDKADNFVLIYGDGKDEKGRYHEIFKLPKGEAFKAILNPVQDVWENIRKGNDPASAKAIAQTIAEFVSGSASPVEFMRNGKPSLTLAMSQATNPVIKAAAISMPTGYDLYRDKSVENTGEAKARAEDRWDDNTPQLYKDLGHAVKNGAFAPEGASPKRLELATKDVIGSFGETIPKAYDAARSAVKGDWDKAKSQAYDAVVDPVKRRFDTAYESANSNDAEDIKAANRQDASDNLAVSRVVKRLTKGGDPEKILREAITNGEISERDLDSVSKRLDRVMNKKADNDSKTDQAFEAASAKVQAQYIYRKLADLKDPEARASYLQEIGQSPLLKRGVEQHLSRLIDEKGFD